MKKLLLTSAVLFFFFKAWSQTNILCTNPVAEQVMKGNYNPQNYLPPVIISHPDSIVQVIMQQVSPDSLHAYLDTLATFYTRNSASDTVSPTTGIGAARRWAYRQFSEISANNNNRLIPSYLQFDNALICNVVQHRNIFAVLPGADTSDKSVVIVEAHIDSRCKDLCSDTCLAQGIEDNGSGTAMVLELARVMSKCVYSRTIVFLLNIAEEQGLYGAAAFAVYAQQQAIQIHAVLNNDVVGGIFCGNTSSPPSCPGFGNIDSLHVRLFSYGGFNSPHKQYARFVKLEYKEEVLPAVSVPTDIMIMSAEDRTGRGGDHQPFRQHFFTAIRMTAANENGNANTTDTSYHDRQHTSDDILGLDINPNPGLDSFFVDFNYLTRNSVINATGLAMAATGPLTPDLNVVAIGNSAAEVTITQQTQYQQYRVGVRTLTNDWDSVYTFNNQLVDTITLPAVGNTIFSVASVDTNSIESLFSREVLVNVVGIKQQADHANEIYLVANTPNPADEQTLISVFSNRAVKDKSCYLVITDINGKEITRIPFELQKGLNEILYNHGFHASGTFWCLLYIENKKIDSAKMVFSD
ncbi:MAG TPA: M28 family peptidase [Bacteroidia bacterium]|nr:M28 family peptidase [Bacteroidia bacterium]